MKKEITGLFCLLIVAHFMMMLITGCAQIGAPTGGPQDTSAPILIRSVPENKKLNFAGNKISLTFNEYVELQDIAANVLISPLQKINPSINGSLKTVTIKFKDSLLPNTTYTINFGSAIKDINEGNVLNNFTFLFSTGANIDSLTIKGKVLMAENGAIDSSLLVLLYRNAPDSAVATRRPNYITRIKGDGSYIFNNLPADKFKVFALKDGDGNKWYNAKTEVFAFNNEEIDTRISDSTSPLYEYAETSISPSVPFVKKIIEKKLGYTSNMISEEQDLFEPLELTFNNTLKTLNKDSIILCDSNFVSVLQGTLVIDSTRRKITIANKWQPKQDLQLIILKGAVEDSSGNKLLKTDTLHFYTKSINQYGSLKITFKNIDLSKHPLMQFMDGQMVKFAFPVLSNIWENKMMLPGEYEVRILYDENNNGVWDPGNYENKKQAEKGITLPQKISLKADWENEREFML